MHTAQGKSELRSTYLTRVLPLAAVIISAFSSRTFAQTNPVDECLARLRDTDLRVVAAQIESLTDSLLTDQRVIGELVDLLDDTGIVQKRMPPAGDDTLEERTWGRIVDMDSTAVPIILSRMRDLKTERAIELALTAISRIGSTDGIAFAELLRYSESTDVSIRSRAIRALGAVGGIDATTVIQLAQFLDDDHPNVRWAAVEALAARKDHLAPVIDSLIQLLEDDSDVYIAISNHFAMPKKLRARVAELLADIGPAAASSLPTLRRLMEPHQSTGVRIWAACAVCKISDEAPSDALELLGDLLLSGIDDENGGNDSAQAIAKLGPRGLPLLDELERAKRHRDSEIRLTLVDAFFAIEPNTAITRVLPMMRDENELVAETVIEALSSRDVSDQSVIDAYVLAVNRFDGLFDEPASSAVDALAKLGHAASMAIPALENLAHNSKASKNLRENASLAIRSIRQDQALPNN